MVGLFFYSVIFIFGLVAGSFLNSIIWRLQTGESFLFKRSYCPHCKTQLTWQDLIPLLSFIILRRKCRYCGGKISLQYPLVEISIGLIFLLIFNQFLPEGVFYFPTGPAIFIFFNLIYYLIISCLLIVIFVYDLKHYIIPDKIIYPAVAITFVYNIFSFFIFHFSFKTFLNPLFSAILISALFIFIILISKGRWMGWGDPKLAFFMGLFLGFPKILIALFFAFFIGAIMGIGLMILRKKTLKSEIPFGPFLVTGTFIALFWSKNIIDWYLRLFF